jgi:hypothetical protein
MLAEEAEITSGLIAFYFQFYLSNHKLRARVAVFPASNDSASGDQR